MNSDDAVLAVIDALAAGGFDFMMVGSFSSNYYGNPRSTRDADFLIQLDTGDLNRFRAALPAELLFDPQQAFESVTFTRKYLITISDSTFRIELFMLTDDPHDQERFQRRRKVELLGRQTFLPAPEDVIITKLRWIKRAHRLKDMDDVQNVLAIQRDILDRDYIHTWCDRHGTRDLLDEMIRQLPPLAPPQAG